MASEGDLKKRVARKLTKRRREGHQVTMDIPERFRDGDDADEDCAAPPDSKAYMNQSVFGMIAAAGSTVDFNARFDGQSSDEEGDSGEPSSSEKDVQVQKTRQDQPAGKSKRHKRKFSEHKLLRSITGLGSKSKTKSSPKSGSPVRESSSESHTPEIQVERTVSHRDAPVMSRMLEAKAELSMRPSFDMKRPSEDHTETDDNGESTSSSLAKRLKEIFEFEKAEDVIEGMRY
jgi:sterol 3beta-glucosyltransferase